MKQRYLAALFAVLLFLGACSDTTEPAKSTEAESAEQDTTTPTADTEAADTKTADTTETAETADTTETAGAAKVEDTTSEACPEITLVTHDSFAITEGTFEKFTEQSCIKVKQVGSGDAGELVAKSVLTQDNPLGDVLFGIDNTFLQRGLDADIFIGYESSELANVSTELLAGTNNIVTPIDYGDVCINYRTDKPGATAPTDLDSLIDPANKDQLVVQHPETSSPGFAFLLSTIATYGDDGWQDYWKALKNNGVLVTAGWSDAYYSEFGSEEGQRSMVVSYATSPPAEVIYADPKIDEPPTAVLEQSCFRQVEYAGILKGTKHQEAAAKLVDFMLSETFQKEIALNMFVYPANSKVALPEEFDKWAPVIQNPLTLTPEEIEANRSEWTRLWVEIVLD